MLPPSTALHNTLTPPYSSPRSSLRLPSSISSHSFNVTLKSTKKGYMKKSEVRAMKNLERKRREEGRLGLRGMDGDSLSLDGGMSMGSFSSG